MRGRRTAYEKVPDVEGCEPSHTEVAAAPRSPALVTLDVAAAVLLCACLLWAPGVLGIIGATVLWRPELNVGLHLLSTMMLLLVVIFPCSAACCGSAASKWSTVRWLRRRRWVTAASLPLGIAAVAAFCLFLVYVDLGKVALRPDYDASLPVAVIGAGPSGLSASWVLAKGGRSVTVFESSGDIGGHSKSYVTDSNGQKQTIDLGFIFNSAVYYDSYRNIAKHFNKSLASTSLNISGYFGGEYWDNTGDFERFDEPLKGEIRRFMGLVDAKQSFLRALTPLWLWLRYHGFSDRFRRLCLDSTMSVLFVTKMGIDKQPAQAVLNHFSPGGFTHLQHHVPKVQINPAGSQFMWRDAVADMQTTGRVQLRLQSRVVAVEEGGGGWTLTLADGSKHGGFGDVVLACPANVAAKVVHGRPLQTFVVSQVGYADASVTLHTDFATTLGSNFQRASNDVLYFVADNHVTGKIGKIFQNPSSDLLLTVHGQEHEALKIDPARTKWQTTWSHHFFSLFELVIARKLLPLFNNGGGLHFAGDWIYGIGHDDAIQSGVHAACAAGVPLRPLDSSSDPLYSELLRRVCRLPTR